MCRPLMNAFETRAIRRALAVVPMCDALADLAIRRGAAKTVVLRDISLLQTVSQRRTDSRELKRELNIQGICFLYLGNLEKYQGIDLLLKSFALLLQHAKGAALVVAGGAPADIADYRRRAEQLGIAAAVHFVGSVPIARMAELFDSADVLVSPRTAGRNTPMKVYSYLDSGKPILATDLPTHTQVLDNEVSALAPPEPEAFAEAMRRLVENPDLRRQLAGRAKALAEEKYSFDVFARTANELYDWISEAHARDR
jgi:glycosyltransferase involved in cell wall biosynthesis